MNFSGHAYATGYKTRDAAEFAMMDMIPEEISECERPRVESYTTHRKDDGKKVTRYAIVVNY